MCLLSCQSQAAHAPTLCLKWLRTTFYIHVPVVLSVTGSPCPYIMSQVATYNLLYPCACCLVSHGQPMPLHYVSSGYVQPSISMCLLSCQSQAAHAPTLCLK